MELGSSRAQGYFDSVIHLRMVDESTVPRRFTTRLLSTDRIWFRITADGFSRPVLPPGLRGDFARMRPL